ncbi:MAG TPA: hypothetical protein VF741_00515, partial [Candidatus Aquilonibacter sp.]
MRLAASILALALFAAPLGALASDHSGGGGGGGSHSSGGSSGGSHAAPAAHSAPAPRSAPVTPPRSAPIGGEPRTLPPGQEPARPSKPAPTQPLPIYRARPPVANPQTQLQPVPNPNNYQQQPWGWNGGIAWIGYGGFWGNGFWGPLAYGLGAASYVVVAGSPGAQ